MAVFSRTKIKKIISWWYLSKRNDSRMRWMSMLYCKQSMTDINDHEKRHQANKTANKTAPRNGINNKQKSPWGVDK